jgi:hypothetical protein
MDLRVGHDSGSGLTNMNSPVERRRLRRSLATNSRNSAETKAALLVHRSVRGDTGRISASLGEHYECEDQYRAGSLYGSVAVGICWRLPSSEPYSGQMGGATCQGLKLEALLKLQGPSR